MSAPASDSTFAMRDGGVQKVGAIQKPEDSADENRSFTNDGTVVLILCGLIASGKSTFAESLQQNFPQFRRCNQDDLGDRRGVEQLTRQSLREGLSVCIDRTNFDASQRFHWIKIAREFPGTAIWIIVFDTPYEVCATRLQTRTGHPTITSPELGLSVLSRFSADFQPPEDHEGHSRILYIKPSDHPSPEYTRSDISTILERVRDSNPVISAASSRTGFPVNASPSRGQSSFRGNPPRGRRGWTGPTTYGRNYNARGGNFASGLSTGFRGAYPPPSRGNNGRGLTSPGRGYRGAWGHPAGMRDNGDQGSSTRSEIGGGGGTARDPYTID